MSTSQQPHKKQLSIIVAAYNIESTIDRIFEHALSSKHLDDFEIIVVSDGSHDETVKKAQAYAQQYPNSVSVIDKENGGHGSTLSAGFKVARGRYCRPLDGDDWLDETNLDTVLNFLSSTDVDMILNDYSIYNIDTKSNRLVSYNLTEGLHSGLSELVEKQLLLPYHGLIFKTDILQQIPEIDHHCFYVDNEYDAYPLPYTKTWYYLPVDLYVHTVGNEEQSTSLKSLVKNIDNISKVCFSLLSYGKKNTANTAAYNLIELYALRLANLYTRASFGLPKQEGKCQLKRFYHQLKENYPKVYSHKYTSVSKLFYVMRSLGGNCYGVMKHIVDRMNQTKVIW